MSIRLLLSYSRRDEALEDELAKHLNLMVRQGLIEPWPDRLHPTINAIAKTPPPLPPSSFSL